MSMSGPKTAPTPAQRPERKVEVEPEDVSLGTDIEEETDDLKLKGKRSLLRPTGAPTTGQGGLQV